MNGPLGAGPGLGDTVAIGVSTQQLPTVSLIILYILSFCVKLYLPP